MKKNYQTPDASFLSALKDEFCDTVNPSGGYVQGGVDDDLDEP